MADRSETQQAWLAAATSGDLHGLQQLLDAHPELLDVRLHHHALKACTALHVCVWRNRSELAAFLVDRGADVGQLDEAGMTALQTDLLRLRLEKMRDVPLLRSRCIDACSLNAVAPFRRKLAPDRAAYHEIETDTFDLLLARGVDVNHRSKTGDTALVTAVELGLTKHVARLIAHGADALIRDGHGRSVLDITGENGFVDIVELLADKFPSLVVADGELALTMAVRHDFSEVLEALCDRLQSELAPADHLSLGGRLLQTAVEYDSPSSVAYLLGRQASTCWTNEKGENAIQLALACRRPQILDLLLDHEGMNGPCPKSIEEKPLTKVATLRHGCIAMEILGKLEPELDFNNKDTSIPERPPTMKPCGLRSMEVLVRHGARFEFPTTGSRDAIAPFLASCIYAVAPDDISELLEELVNRINCVPQNKLRRVLVALIWSSYSQEVLTLVLLMLFSSSGDSAGQALAVFDPWLEKFEANVVVKKLLVDSLQR